MTILHNRLGGDFASPGVVPSYAPDLGLEPVDLDLSVRLDFDSRAVEGDATYTLVVRDAGATLTLNAALFDSGRPVLVTPPGDQGGASKPFSVGGHVAISWNGSAEAARSVGSAMGLISKADKVTVLTVDSDRTSAARAPELADYLEWHGVVPDTRTFSADSGPSIGEALLAECGTLGVDLLVMGAYTHSRVRQLILGGVTRHVLEQATLPLFMAH